MRLAFVMDQQVGLKTHALTLKRHFPDATFIDVRYDAGFFKKLPGSGTLAGVREIRAGLGALSRFDAVVWASWATKFVPDLVEAAPSYLVMDMTPTQMTAMGELYGYTTQRAGFFGGWKRRATGRIYHAARHFFPWNTWVAQSLVSDWGVPKEKITPLSPGVDTALFTPGPDNGERGRARVLFVGGDFVRKGGDVLLRWARETAHSVELHLVTRDSVEDVPENVHVHRNVAPLSEELVALYQQSDVFALPTRADCYSLVALEAMACGLPIVITPLGGIPELIEEGKTGFLIPPDNYTALAARLDALVSDPALRTRLGAAARERACRLFDARCLAQTLRASLTSPSSGEGEAIGRGGRGVRA
jgi:hypothetical protein